MREIKFRAWDGKSIRHGCEWILIDSGDGAVWENTGSGYENDILCERDWKVMQYTGLKDKNGVDIYEGDILEREFDGFRFEVKFRHGMFCACQNTNDKFEVIGNIYENPELLEKE